MADSVKVYAYNIEQRLCKLGMNYVKCTDTVIPRMLTLIGMHYVRGVFDSKPER